MSNFSTGSPAGDRNSYNANDLFGEGIYTSCNEQGTSYEASMPPQIAPQHDLRNYSQQELYKINYCDDKFNNRNRLNSTTYRYVSEHNHPELWLPREVIHSSQIAAPPTMQQPSPPPPQATVYVSPQQQKQIPVNAGLYAFPNSLYQHQKQTAAQYQIPESLTVDGSVGAFGAAPQFKPLRQPPPVIWRRNCNRKECNQKVEPNVTKGEEKIIEAIRTPLKNFIPTIHAAVTDSIANVQSAVDIARSRLLDWIYPHDANTPFVKPPPCPPCPPCNVLCNCNNPTKIYKINDFVCGCGEPGNRCGDCMRPISRCPACGQPYRSFSLIPNPCSIFSAAINSKPVEQPEPLPQLIVTNIGPFRDKLDKQKKCEVMANFDCGQICQGMAYDCGSTIGRMLPYCKKRQPAAPIPGRPIRRMMPFFFPSALPKRQKFPWNLCSPKTPEIFDPPHGGIVGAAEDLTAVGVGLVGCAVDAAADVLDQLIGTPEEYDTSKKVCYLHTLPPLRYPKNGVYEDLEDSPTKPTGWRLVDAVNNFMDAVVLEPSKPEDVKLLEQSEISDTEKTGNPIVDGINKCLDHLVTPPPTKPTVTSVDFYKSRDPFNALRTYFFEKPQPMPESSSFFPCLQRDTINGKTWIDKYVPGIFFGESSKTLGNMPWGRDINYVNFNLVPSTYGQISRHSGTSHNNMSSWNPVVPIAY